MGYNRIAGRYSAGQTKAHDARVNYVHRDDAVAIIKLSIQREETSNTFDVTAPNHPKQSEVFSQNANKFGWEKTYFKSNEVLGKRVSSQKLMAHFNYRFLYPNPLEFW
jgi:nucleoside-diphosphate-sugar epimerase